MRPTTAPPRRALIDDEDARKAFERARWPDGPICPGGHSTTQVTPVKGGRAGLYRCSCGSQFTVTVGTFMEGTHVALGKWWWAIHLAVEGATARKIEREIHVSYKTALRMKKEIRHALGKGGRLIYAAKKLILRAGKRLTKPR